MELLSLLLLFSVSSLLVAALFLLFSALCRSPPVLAPTKEGAEGEKGEQLKEAFYGQL